jgi:hypothetical protein
MHPPLSSPRDDQSVEVLLGPLQARQVAQALRIQLASAVDRPFDEPLPSREDAARLRTVLNLCVDQLEALAWGEPPGEVRMRAPRRLLEAIAQDLLDGGRERLADPVGRTTPETQRVRRQGRSMIRAAEAINGALAADVPYPMAS